MDIAKLIERHDAIVADAAALLRKGATPAVLLARPLALHAAQGERIAARIEALEGEKKDVTARIDDEIRALKGELKGVEARMAVDRKNFAPALKASDAVPGKERPGRVTAGVSKGGVSKKPK